MSHGVSQTRVDDATNERYERTHARTHARTHVEFTAHHLHVKWRGRKRAKLNSALKVIYIAPKFSRVSEKDAARHLHCVRTFRSATHERVTVVRWNDKDVLMMQITAARKSRARRLLVRRQVTACLQHSGETAKWVSYS
jgi:hypothetical protein